MVINSEMLNAFYGGVLIALASSFNLLLKGRITGISGILFGVVTPQNEGFFWKISFLTGLLFASNYFYLFDSSYFESFSNFKDNFSLIGFLISGFLVGFGTKLGNGCTSGHGVCGIPRLSKRSILACLVFCCLGSVIANLSFLYPNFLTKIGDSDFIGEKFVVGDDLKKIFMIVYTSITIILFGVVIFMKKKISDFLISYLTGIIFSSGLVISGMVKRSKVINFLKFSSEWDPSLLIVLLTAVGINLLLFYLIIQVKKTPVFGQKMELPTKINIDWPLVIGSGIFGLGWGLSGLCPGPLLANILNYSPYTLFFLVTLVMGQFMAVFVENRIKAAADSYVNLK
jgi:uncharacterized membrane protein YedE/YeeE